MIINNGLCIIPRNNLIDNIGWGKYATHTKSEKKRIWDVPVRRLGTPLRHPSIVAANADFDQKYGELLFRDKLKEQIKNKNMYGSAGMLLKHYFRRI